MDTGRSKSKCNSVFSGSKFAINSFQKISFNLDLMVL